MIILGIILLVAGFLLKISILWTIGLILIVVGVKRTKAKRARRPPTPPPNSSAASRSARPPTSMCWARCCTSC